MFAFSTLIQLLCAFCATVSFSFLFNAPRSEVLLCGITGAVGWFFYLIVSATGDIVLATLIAALSITFISRFLSVRRKMPITIFMICGIFPLVPGAGIYGTMYSVITEDITAAAIKGIETLKLAGVIAIGIIVVLSLPGRLFSMRRF